MNHYRTVIKMTIRTMYKTKYMQHMLYRFKLTNIKKE